MTEGLWAHVYLNRIPHVFFGGGGGGSICSPSVSLPAIPRPYQYHVSFPGLIHAWTPWYAL